VTETNSGASGASTPSVSQSLKEASSDLGGKNSNETRGLGMIYPMLDLLGMDVA
jgi:hypothetical protein